MVSAGGRADDDRRGCAVVLHTSSSTKGLAPVRRASSPSAGHVREGMERGNGSDQADRHTLTQKGRNRNSQER